MKLYHGSCLAIEKIDLAKCKPFKDFGKGFYLTLLKTQAQEWAKKMLDRPGASGKPTVTVYELGEIPGDLNVLRFKNPSLEWAHFIMNNRTRHLQGKTELDNRNAQYDIVDGPVGNDDIATTLNLFLMGLMDDTALVEQLKSKKLNHQMSFHTKRALNLLVKVGSYEV
jgi:hypothetical protein